MIKNYALATVVATGLAFTGNAVGDTITFDLSGYALMSTQVNFGSLNYAGGGVVTNVEWNLTYLAGSSVGSGSWANEVAIELIGPGAVPNSVTATGWGVAPGGFHPDTPGNAGTFIWGSVSTWAPDFAPGGDSNSYDLGWINNSTSVQNSVGSTDALNGWAGDGDWVLNLYDSYNDTIGGASAQGTFMDNSTITIEFSTVPAPAALALLGIAGAVGTSRRRR